MYVLKNILVKSKKPLDISRSFLDLKDWTFSGLSSDNFFKVDLKKKL